MFTDRYYNTKTEIIGGKHYCVYCASEAKNDYEYEDRERYDYYFCNCDGANAERECELEINTINEKYAKRLRHVENKLNDLRFEAEVERLKYKYKKK